MKRVSDVRLRSSYPCTEKRQAHLYTSEGEEDAIITVIYESIQITCMHTQLSSRRALWDPRPGRVPHQGSLCSPSLGLASAIAVTKINVSGGWGGRGSIRHQIAVDHSVKFYLSFSRLGNLPTDRLPLYLSR
jgi:hypothetical protein